MDINMDQCVSSFQSFMQGAHSAAHRYRAPMMYSYQFFQSLNNVTGQCVANCKCLYDVPQRLISAPLRTIRSAMDLLNDIGLTKIKLAMHPNLLSYSVESNLKPVVAFLTDN